MSDLRYAWRRLRSTPGFTCTADITTATREKALTIPIQAMAVRDIVYDESGEIVRRDPEERRRGRSSMTASAEELPSGQTQRETEGVFVLRDGRAVFQPAETGIAQLFNRYDNARENLTLIRETVAAAMHARSEAIGKGRFRIYERTNQKERELVGLPVGPRDPRRRVDRQQIGDKHVHRWTQP